jgi:hypothetical protein
MKAVPVARELAGLRIELGPALLAVDGVHLFLVGAGVVVDDHVGVGADAVLVENLDEVFEFGAIAIECLYCTALIEVSEVEVVVGIIARGAGLSAFANRRKP